MSRTPYSLNSYTGGAQALYLAGSGIGAADTTLTLSGSTASWSPLGTTGGWYLSVGYGTANEEKMFVPSGSWNYTSNYVTLSGITRGIDYTTAVAQSGSVTCIPVITSTDISEANYAANLLYNGGTTGPLVISGKVTINGNATISGMTITGGTTTSGYVLTATSPSGSTWTAPVGAALPTSVNVWNGSSYTTLSNANSAFITGSYGAQSSSRTLAYMTLSAGTWLLTAQISANQTSNTSDTLSAYLSVTAGTLVSAGSYFGTGSGQDETITLSFSTAYTVASGTSTVTLGAQTLTANGSILAAVNGLANATGMTAVRIA